MTHSYTNPLRSAVSGQSAQQWQKALTLSTSEQILDICQDSSVWGNLSPFKSFLFARHTALLKPHLGDHPLEHMIANCPNLLVYINTIGSDGVSAGQVSAMLHQVLWRGRVETAAKLLDAANPCLRFWLIEKLTQVRHVSQLWSIKDPAFFAQMRNHMPALWQALLSKCDYHIRIFNTQNQKRVLSVGELQEENELFIAHISVGNNHQSYVTLSPNFFLAFLLTKNTPIHPQHMYEQCQQMKCRVWVNFLAHLYNLGMDDWMEYFTGTLDTTFEHLTFIPKKEYHTLQQRVRNEVVKNQLLAEVGALGREKDNRKI